MHFKPHHQTAIWLIVSALLLSSLIPGGPIENRDFSHIHPGILGTFNLFLTVLDLGSFVVAYFAYRQRTWAIQAAFYAACAYFTVYAVDLAQLFPRSPTPMSLPLALVEVLGMAAAVPLMFASKAAQSSEQVDEQTITPRRYQYATTVTLVVLGITIIWFATDAAMSGGSATASTNIVVPN